MIKYVGKRGPSVKTPFVPTPFGICQIVYTCMSVYIYIYIYIYTCMCIYIYIYIYIHNTIL